MKVFNQVFLSVVLMLSSLGQVAQGAIDPGQAYFNQGNFKEAAEYWEEARQLVSQNDPKYIDTSIYLVAAYQALGRLESALAIWQDVGQLEYKWGHFEKAVEYWEKARQLISRNVPKFKNAPKKYIDTSLHLAKAYQALGRMWEAYEVLDDTLDLYEGKESYQVRAEVFMQLSDFYVEMRNFNKNRGSCEMKDVVNTAIGNKKLDIAPSAMLNSASDYLNKALANLLEKDSLLKAKILNRHGNILILQEKSVEGLSLYEKALGILASNDEQEARMLRVKIELNLLQGTIDNGEKEKSKTKLNALSSLISKLSASHNKNFALISLAQLTKKLFYDEEKEIFLKAPFDKKAFDRKGKLFVHALLNNALEAAKKQQDRRSRIYALFELAKLYGLDKRYQDSISLLREAIFHTQDYQMSSEKPDILYRLEWKLIEYLNLVNSKNHQQVIESIYKNAAKHIEDMEDTYTVLPKDFNKQKEKLFFEYADFLLKKAYRMLDVTDEQKAAKQKVLKEAIKTIESSKVAEVKDYLQDSCLTKELEEQVEHLDDNLPSDVAIFYPLLFEDRIESLVVTNDGIKQSVNFYTANKENTFKILEVSASSIDNCESDILNKSFLQTAIENFRRDASLPKKDGGKYKTTIYNCFKESFLSLKEKKVDTIIIVPDKKLYKIPFKALYDNDSKEYLIQRYALATTPSIRLIDMRLTTDVSNRLLASGLSIFKDNDNLCLAATEIMNISCMFQNKKDTLQTLRGSNCLKERTDDCNKNEKYMKYHTYSELRQCLIKEKNGSQIVDNCMENVDVLLEEDFTTKRLENLFIKNKYSNVHISTHGKFGGVPNKTFLHTFGGNINMPKLRTILSKGNKTKSSPNLDLLVLSACESAIGQGDELASFGLASTAINTKVSSVLGTLWLANEDVTKKIMTDFYANHYTERLTKAKALQDAIKKLLTDSKNEDSKNDFSDPYFWAPFILIGKGV